MRRLLGILVALAALACLPRGTAWADEPACPAPLVGRQRFGFVATDVNWPQQYDIARLRAGWYVDHQRATIAPTGMDRALVIRTPASFRLDPVRLGPLIEANPGAVWLIGNEPDCIWQDDVLPERYAQIYHDLYAYIKGLDAASQVAAGGIVQPTPLRLEYLDRVLAAYRAAYHQQMPVDVWHIHNAILNEERGSWGAEIPPGSDAAAGELRALDDNDNLAIFQDQIWAFRRWMAEHGYGGLPLVVTEYGVLMPKDYGFDEARVNRFMSSTFDFLLSASDPALGDPTDGYRLVQRWAWFSLDVPPYDPVTLVGFNGNLYNPQTKQITAMGLNFADETASFPPVAYADLSSAQWRIARPPPALAGTPAAIWTVQIKVVNSGTVAAAPVEVSLTYTGPASGSEQRVLPSLPPATSGWVTFDLTGLGSGAYSLSVKVDPGAKVAESRECNNQSAHSFVVGTELAFLPLVSLHSPSGSPPIHGAETAQGALPAGPGDGAPGIPGFQEYPVPTPGSYPAQIALDAQGWVWVTERDGNKIARFDPVSASWREYPVPTPGSQPWDLAVTANGQVWFTESAADRIGKLVVATDGSYEFQEFQVPTLGSQPWDVSLNTDGTIWFTERAANRIAKFVPPSGPVTEYTGLSPNARPAGIAAAGTSIWFVAAGADSFGRLKTDAGTITERSRPPGSTPQEVVLTEAGNLWWTESGGNRIVSFAPSTLTFGTVVVAPTPNSEPFGIALEGNRAVWFAERAANQLARWHRPFSDPIEFRLPTPNSAPTGIVIDGAGCAWYTAPAANQIGRFCPYQIHLPSIPQHGS